MDRIRRVSGFKVLRAEANRALVWGVAYPALDPPEDGVLDAEEATLRVDSYRTWMRPETLQRFAHDFMERGRAIDAHHDHGIIGTLVESYMTRAGDEHFPPDCWVAAVKVYDAGVLAALDKEELKGFSIEMLLPGGEKGYREHTFTIRGSAKKLLTWELLAPEPTFLSLVKNPATGIPFAEVEMRDDAAPWERADEDAGGVTPLVRCADARTKDEDAMPNDDEKTSADTDARTDAGGAAPPDGAPEAGATDTARAQEVPAPAADAPLTREARVRRVVERVAQRAETAPSAESVDAVVASITKREGAEVSTRATTFAEAWAATKDWTLFKSSVWSALYLLEGMFYDILYFEALGEQPALIAQAVSEFQVALGEVVTEYAPKLEGRAAAEIAERAGKAISAANLTKIQSARDACDGAIKHLDDLIAGASGSTEAETQSDSADAVRERVAVLERELGAARELAEARARDAAAQVEARTSAETKLREADAARAKLDADLSAARSALTTESAARTAAEARVKELETRTPAPRSGGADPEAQGPGVRPEARERDPFDGVLFGR